MDLEDFISDMLDEFYIPVDEPGSVPLDVRGRLEVFKKYHQCLEALLTSITEDVRGKRGGKQGVNSCILRFWARTLDTEHWKYYGAPWLSRVAEALMEVATMQQHMWGRV